MSRWLAVAVFVASISGCYTRRHIIVPASEHGRLCVNDASMSWQLCVMQQRGYAFCDRRKDDELLRCEGAYEQRLGGDAGVETDTYGLPGFKP